MLLLPSRRVQRAITGRGFAEDCPPFACACSVEMNVGPPGVVRAPMLRASVRTSTSRGLSGSWTPTLRSRKVSDAYAAIARALSLFDADSAVVVGHPGLSRRRRWTRAIADGGLTTLRCCRAGSWTRTRCERSWTPTIRSRRVVDADAEVAMGRDANLAGGCATARSLSCAVIVSRCWERRFPEVQGNDGEFDGVS